jgi:peptidoglycan/LPS O-acetylase OafA/YrhL
METKKTQAAWLVLATLFVGGMVFFVTDSLAVTSIAGAFTGVVGVFLGIDIMTMIHKTRELPPGTYKEMNRHRYVLALCVFASLLAEAFFISGKYGREMDSLYLCFGVGFIVVIGGLVGGIEGNKIVTGTAPVPQKEPAGEE